MAHALVLGGRRRLLIPVLLEDISRSQVRCEGERRQNKSGSE